MRNDAPAVRWMGVTLLIGDSVPRHVVPLLPREEDRTTVMLSEPIPDVDTLAALLRTHLSAQTTTVRLIASGAARFAPQLVEATGLEIVAADGQVLVVPGALFVATVPPDPTAATGEGNWWIHRPHERPQPVSPRYPDPGWRASPPRPGRCVLAHAVPAGLWLRGMDTAATLDDTAFSLPPVPDRITVLIGQPGTPAASMASFAALLERLPDEVLANLRLVPYGVPRALVYDLAAYLASDTRTVEVVGGAFTGRNHLRWLVDDNGSPSYPPAAQLSIAVAGEPPKVVLQTDPFSGRPVSAGPIPLSRGTVVEVIAAGLWLRVIGSITDSQVAPDIAPGEEELLIVDGPAGQAETLWTDASELLHRLPPFWRGIRLVATSAEIAATVPPALTETYGAPILFEPEPTTSDPTNPEPTIFEPTSEVV